VRGIAANIATVTANGNQSLAPTFHIDVPVMDPHYSPQIPRPALETPVRKPLNNGQSTQTALWYPTMHEDLPPPEVLWRTKPARNNVCGEQLSQFACRSATLPQSAFVYSDDEQALTPAHAPATQNIANRRLPYPGTERDNQVAFSNNSRLPGASQSQYEESYHATATILPAVVVPDQSRFLLGYEPHSYSGEMGSRSEKRQKLEQQIGMAEFQDRRDYHSLAYNSDC